MRQPRRAAAEIPQTRFTGAVWTVAMCDRDWGEFCALPLEANLRLTVLLEHFCASGEDNLPTSALRWMTPDEADPQSQNAGAFEAKGVVLHGRKASGSTGPAFFVTRIIVDPPPVAPLPRRKRNNDDRQEFLPLPLAVD